MPYHWFSTPNRHRINDGDLIAEIAQSGPIRVIRMCSSFLRDTLFISIYFTTAGVVPLGDRKKSPRTSL